MDEYKPINVHGIAYC